jgi:hypothetical protein
MGRGKTMTLEYVLNAAVNSMVNGHHGPHCYSAHVPHQGYVNDGSAAFDRADYLRQLERDARSEVENMGFASHYAEPGYGQPRRGVVFANWNRLPRNIDAILERMGFAVEWSDEWSTCDDCNGAVRTEPDGYDWKPSYRIVDDALVCSGCNDSEDDV